MENEEEGVCDYSKAFILVAICSWPLLSRNGVRVVNLKKKQCFFHFFQVNEFETNFHYTSYEHHMKLSWNTNLDDTNPNSELCTFHL